MSAESTVSDNPNCSARVFGKDQTLDLRNETRLPSCLWSQTDVDKLFHRYRNQPCPLNDSTDPKYWTDNGIHHFGSAEIKFGGREIDERTPGPTGVRIRSQYDTLSRFFRFVNSGKHGNIDRRIPGVSGDWNGQSWDIFHGFVGIELSGNDPSDSQITWARPTQSRWVTSRLHMPATVRTTISYDTLVDLLRFERSWDDPSKQIGHKGVGIHKDSIEVCNGIIGSIADGLRLSDCGSFWIVGDKASTLKHPR